MDDHVLELAESYWRDELDSSRKSEVTTHLSRCAECRSTYDAVGVAIRELVHWADAPPISPALMARIVRSRPRTGPQWWRLAAAAALVALLAGSGGYAAGRSASINRVAPSRESALRTFILLLEEPSWPPTRPLNTARTGYMDWVQELQSVGRYVNAEKLTEEPGVRIGVDGNVRTGTSPNFSGWYLLRARDYEEAVSLARLGPHLRYGSILVRQLE